MNLTDMMSKMRALYHFIKRQQKHREAFGIHPIRAVLIETTNEHRARKLMQLAEHPLVSGTKRAGLFWFSISPVFTTPEVRSRINESRPTPVYMNRPEIVLERIWALPDYSLHRLGDMENFGAARG